MAAREATDQADVMRRFVRNLLRAADPDLAGGRPLMAAEILANAETRIRQDMGGTGPDHSDMRDRPPSGPVVQITGEVSIRTSHLLT